MSNKIITGYKATDENMKCRDHQFELGKWYSVDGKLEMCGNGFHFCEQPSGPWAYYSDEGTRIFKCEAKEVLKTPWQAGADRKLVARYIRLVEEVVYTGYGNTTNYSSGFFCQEEPTVVSFDIETGMSRSKFIKKFGALADSLSDNLTGNDEIDFDYYKSLPGITPQKLKSLHEKFIAARRELEGK